MIEQLTDDRRPLYQIVDPATRELRYREMLYECERLQRSAWAMSHRFWMCLQEAKGVVIDFTAIEDPQHPDYANARSVLESIQALEEKYGW